MQPNIKYRQCNVDRALELAMIANSLGLHIVVNCANLPRWYKDLPITAPATFDSDKCKVQHLLSGATGYLVIYPEYCQPSPEMMLSLREQEPWSETLARAEKAVSLAKQLNALPPTLKDLNPACINLFKTAISRLNLTVEVAETVLQFAHTIALACGNDKIKPEHLAESICYQHILSED